MKKRSRKLRLIILITLALLFLAVLFLGNSPFRSLLRSIGNNVYRNSGAPGTATIQSEIKNTNNNYGAEIDKYAEYFELPASYFKALVIMECSGKKPAGSRYEAHVYKNLVKLRNGSIKEYKGLKKENIADAENEALKNLATSWGPFQLMGYQCITMNIPLEDIRGNNAVFWGMKSINTAYGTYLKDKQYQDAFHIHNTGLEYPENGRAGTTNPNYTQNGITLMGYF